MGLIKVSQAQGRVPVTIFHLQDRVNLGNTTEFEQAAQKVYDNGVRDLIIDLSLAPSITSAGIRAVMVIYKLFNSGDGKHLKLVSPTSYVREVLEIAGISDHIEIFNTVEEAVASY